MENPFKNISQKEWLYIAGAVASLIALALVFGGGKINFGKGVINDTPNAALGTDPTAPTGGGGTPFYTGYNMPPLNPVSLGTPGELAAGDKGCCCPSAYGCAGPTQLDDGTAYTGIPDLLGFLRDINPNYQKLVETQQKLYVQMFATGQTYSAGAASVNLPNN